MMPKACILRILFIFFLLLVSLFVSHSVLAEGKKPDLVFIIVDDLNDWIGVMGGHPQANTPNIDFLASKGALFTNAHCNAPQCGPSRASLLLGLYPKSTGKYFNSTKRPSFFKEQAMQGVRSVKKGKGKYLDLHQHFKKQNYRVVSGGKVAHAGIPRNLHASFKRPDDLTGNWVDEKENLWKEGGAHFHPVEKTGDYKVAKWAISEWKQVSEKPLFMTVGFYRPHRPFNAPKAYFDKFPLASIQLPALPEFSDLEDLPEYGKALAHSNAHKNNFNPRTVHQEILHRGGGGVKEWQFMVQSYLACVHYVDEQIGLFLNALKINPRDRDTVIVLTSDHGWNLGEKEHWCKAALWRNTTRVPFIVYDSRKQDMHRQNHQPISHVDIYPSLCDFAGISKPTHLEGKSIRPLLDNPVNKRDFSFINYGPENIAAQSERFRYILYEDGSEELYDHQNDPHEWLNLSQNPEYLLIKKKHKEGILSFKNEKSPFISTAAQ